MEAIVGRHPVRRWLLAALVPIALGAATPACSDTEEPQEAPSALTCDAGDQAWVRQSLLVLNGRRAHSQAEVAVWTDILTKMKERGDAELDARRAVARAMMFDSQPFRERWSEFFMDSLRVLRSVFARGADSWIDKVQASACYGPDLKDPLDGGALAAWVRDHAPTEGSPPFPSFDLGRLLASSIILDDVTPIYRAHLFHLIQFPMSGANVDPLEREAARRMDFGTSFEAAYLHRDTSCSFCHNAVFSTTSHADPTLNRFWPVPGRFEAALFGSDFADGDPLVYRSMFRVMDVRLDEGGIAPWGWNRPDCGGFANPSSADPLAVETRFASVSGKFASVWDLEFSLRRGIETLRETGLVLQDDGSVEPDTAFAYLVASSIAEQVWEEVQGSGLTIAHKFPRNADQRDVLAALTQTLIDSDFSLKALLTEIVVHPLFNLPDATQWCDEEPYSLPAVLNPWSKDDTDATKRGNSVGDAVYPLSAAVLQRSVHQAMEWDPPSAFPKTAAEEAERSSLGLFTSSTNPGFRGLGFQPKLHWEARYAACEWQGKDDYISGLTTAAQSASDVTLADAVIALKDRLVGEPLIDPLEVGPLEGLIGRPLTTVPSTVPVADLDRSLRMVCGAYVASPQTLLGGLPPIEASAVPKLTPAKYGYGASCSAVRTMFEESKLPYVISCFDDSVTVSRR